MNNAIEVKELSKHFSNDGISLKAVQNLSFTVPEGEIFGFCGENGAGKSTSISCITTLLEPSSGNITVAGYDIGENNDEIRSKIGVVFQKSLLDDLLTSRENLQTRGALYGLSKPDIERKITELTKLLHLDEFLDRRYKVLSGGEKRRVDIARALIQDPKILFLDEPTTGLDPQSRAQVWKTVENLRNERGLTVFLTTHYMEETENADRILIIDHGQAKAEGTPAELRAKYSKDILVCTTKEKGTFGIEVKSAAQAMEYLRENQSNIQDFEFRHGTMNDVFLNLTSKEAAK